MCRLLTTIGKDLETETQQKINTTGVELAKKNVSLLQAQHFIIKSNFFTDLDMHLDRVIIVG
jgi:hypothetical protein